MLQVFSWEGFGKKIGSVFVGCFFVNVERNLNSVAVGVFVARISHTFSEKKRWESLYTWPVSHRIQHGVFEMTHRNQVNCMELRDM